MTNASSINKLSKEFGNFLGGDENIFRVLPLILRPQEAKRAGCCTRQNLALE